MWADLTKLSVSPFDLILRAFVIYFTVVFLLRISGKRQIGQMAATEFVVILLISNAVQNSLNAGDNSLVGGMILAIILVLISWLIAQLTFRSKKMSDIFEGTPTLLIHDGKVIEKHLTKELMSLSDLKVMLRKRGIQDPSMVQTAILEADGHLSVIGHTNRPDVGVS